MSKHAKNTGPASDAQKADEALQNQQAAADAGQTAAEQAPADQDAAQPVGPAADATAKDDDQLAARDKRIAALEEEVSSLKDQYLRKLADYENFRKRMFREKDEAVQYANTQLLSDLITVIDDFDRAVQSSETSRDFQSLHDGVDMIRKGLLSMLESRYGLVRFDALETAFDPNLHEAMMSEPGECEQPTVVEEYCKGYKLRERVLRSAKVKVRMPVAQTAE